MAEQAIQSAKRAIDEYNGQILRFLSEDGKSQVKATIFMSTYAEIQRVSDENDRSDSMYDYYKLILTNYMDSRVIPAI